jgi:hypothetical protein
MSSQINDKQEKVYSIKDIKKIHKDNFYENENKNENEKYLGYTEKNFNLNSNNFDNDNNNNNIQKPYFYENQYEKKTNNNNNNLINEYGNENGNEKMYGIQVLKGMEVGPKRTTLKNIYLTKARIYPVIIPKKHKIYIDTFRFLYKLNFVVFSFSSIYLLGYKKRTPDSFKKLTFISGIFYFTFLFLDWRMRLCYNDSFDELRKIKSEEEIVNLINSVSTKTRIII